MITQSVATELSKRAPFAGPCEDYGSMQVPVTGTLPDWLRGALVRTAPMLGASLPWEPEHLFDAIALAFRIDVGGPAMTLRWARIESATAEAARTGRVPITQFMTRNGRGFLDRVLHPRPVATDNPNVNIVQMGSDLVALTESANQWILDRETLRARGRVAYDDDLGRSALMLAHPHLSKEGVTNLAYEIDRVCKVMLYTHGATSRSRTLLGEWATPELPYLHSFALTDRAAVVIGHPFTATARSMLWSNDGFIEHFRWRPERGTRLVMLDRRAGRTQTSREFETDPFFVFHVVHAFETADSTVIDLLAYDDVRVIHAATTKSVLRGGTLEFPAKLRRLSIARATGKVQNELLSDTPFEFPQVDAEMAHGHAPTVVFGASIRASNGNVTGDIVSVETQSGARRVFHDANWVFGEPVFVGKPGRTREGDGVLLTIGSNVRASALFVLDAGTLEVVARAEFRTPLPIGLHGSFVPS